MHELPADFGTGLRAHLGLGWAEPTAREASLAGRACGLLAAAQALYAEVLGGPADHDDELARLRRRRSVA